MKNASQNNFIARLRRDGEAMKSQEKQAIFTSNLIFTLFPLIVIIQNIYYQLTFEDNSLLWEYQYIHYRIVWLVLVTILIIIIFLSTKNKVNVLYSVYGGGSITLMPLLIENYGYYTVIGYLITTLIVFLIDRRRIYKKYNPIT